MNKHIGDVHSLLLPLQEDQMLLPNAAVAEIIEYRSPTPLDDGPDWCLGQVNWRGLDIPLVSYEAFVGNEAPAESVRMRIAVLNTLNGNDRMPFIGVVLKGIPRLLTAGRDSVNANAEATLAEGMLAQVQVGAEAAVIPDIDALERSVTALVAA